MPAAPREMPPRATKTSRRIVLLFIVSLRFAALLECQEARQAVRQSNVPPRRPPGGKPPAPPDTGLWPLTEFVGHPERPGTRISPADSLRWRHQKSAAHQAKPRFLTSWPPQRHWRAPHTP